MRRLRSDLILVFEIMKGFVKVEADRFINFLGDPRTRGTLESLDRPAG